jgi:trypsin-like peptidase
MREEPILETPCRYMFGVCGGGFAIRFAARLCLALVFISQLTVSLLAQSNDDDRLKIYAVNVVKTPPFQNQFNGEGIYLGQGVVITAAHVVGHFPAVTQPRVLIAGQDLPAQIIKQGSFESIDLAILSIDQNRLPVNLLLRRNPLCTGPLRIGEEVVDVTPQATTRVQIISPAVIPAELRKRFKTVVAAPQPSGSGIFDAHRKCLLGIMSAQVSKRRYVNSHNRAMAIADGYAGYFVPAASIAYFIPPEYQFLLPRSSGFNVSTP